MTATRANTCTHTCECVFVYACDVICIYLCPGDGALNEYANEHEHGGADSGEDEYVTVGGADEYETVTVDDANRNDDDEYEMVGAQVRVCVCVCVSVSASILINIFARAGCTSRYCVCLFDGALDHHLYTIYTHTTHHTHSPPPKNPKRAAVQSPPLPKYKYSFHRLPLHSPSHNPSSRSPSHSPSRRLVRYVVLIYGSTQHVK
jgi:hypothetical protein